MPEEKEKQMPKYYIPLPDFSAILESLPPELNETKKHFIQASKEFLLAIRSMIDATITIADKLLEEKPKAEPAKKVKVK
ncbi:hypothetical protein JGI3_00996 [Candidatus Kryptobacter tengchongensis]|uniref:Uncharacterized protein n=1 Tax=Kryptobacter tengchongensis TaxID=1643429 RepID=A0A656D4X3_KRYT1|nr:hypothetical protein [Candidatus Kryptobacter tengchongensis]CUS99707.1 hypothetical protein JGI25_00618 [Candidatus Kryptobacter tengchongensis]CUT03371.1 hypothetical protein JGI24_01292 [Candidatus Kryptobacter tengchongensis]CUU04640.1 hypothetical protein JGI3_00996 [Candidatus Kryptobacter tengchongensis]CUU05748.1 hypothetical protein JGI2_01296 [Candidatus Kryptobacter tengchongensis]